LAIALLSALHRMKGERPGAEQLVHDALHVENVMLGNINGGQDQYAAALGGFNAFRFEGEDVDVRPLDLAPAFVRSLEERSVLCYCGDSRVSGHILDQVMAHYRSGDRGAVASLRTMRRIAHETEQALVGGSLDDLAALIAAAGEIQQALHEAMTPPAVQRLMEIGRAHGVHAAKMAGAGGGGCVFFLCPPEQRPPFERALNAAGVPVLPVQFSPRGVLTTVTDT
jgi:D-glycero-alpha-D-manno-heptose-7-phosphate kinase